jgi:hypothetical protein
MNKYFITGFVFLTCFGVFLYLRGMAQTQKIEPIKSSSRVSFTREDIEEHLLRHEEPMAYHEFDKIRDTTGRDLMVAEKLQRFRDKTADISAESVAQERAKIAHGLQAASQKKSYLPVVTRTLDNDGQKWEVLDYGDGIIRYMPSVEIMNP